MEENWIEVYEIEDYQKKKEAIWLEQMLIDCNIPYKDEIEEYWIGVKLSKYKKRLKIFVQKKDEETVKKYIEEFEDSKSIIKENVEELKETDDEKIDVETKRYNKIRKIGIILWLVFLFIVIIFGITATIMSNI